MPLVFKVGHIYLIRNLINGKGYIGQTVKKLTVRHAEHLRNAKNGSGYAIHCAIRKYGEKSFSITTVATCVSPLLNDLEEYFIKFYGTFAETGHGYNMTQGGKATSGWHPSEETRKKISASNKGRKNSPEAITKAKATKASKPPFVYSEELREKMSAASKGKKKPRKNKKPPVEKRPKFGFTHSEETRKKLSESNRGKRRSEETKRKLSEAHKGKLQSPETIAKRAAANTGKKRSDETKAIMKAAQARRYKKEI